MSARTQGLRLVSLTMVLLVLGLAATTSADTIYVCWDGSGDYLTIQEGIDAAEDGDEVVVCDGTYTGPGNRDLNFGGKLITVCSENGPENCVIDCQATENDPHRGFYFHMGETADAAVEGFTITNARAGGGGGMCCLGSDPTVTNCTFSANSTTSNGIGGAGMYNFGANPTVANCTFVGNTSYAPVFGGGGMNNCNSSPTVTNCTFSGNRAYGWGGAMLNWDDSSPTVTNCTFSVNTASDDGGGMYNEDQCYPTVTNCTFSENTASELGGGMANYRNSSPRVTNCTFSGNSARCGGGIYCHASSPTITSCILKENCASFCGGGIFNYQGHLTVTNCAFSGNSGGDNGGAIYNESASLTVTNCILWGDTPDEVHPYGGVTYSDVQGGYSGKGNIDADPLFVDPDNGDYHVSAGSPCIDSGCNGGVPRDSADLDNDGDTDEITPLDLDGEGRFFDDPDTPDTGCGFVPIVDMGAYEFGDSGPQPCPGDLDGDRDVDHSDLGILLSLWGATDECDLDCDGDIDHSDLGILLAHWGEGCP